MYKIGQAAKLLGVTTQALRFFEQEGVMHPKKTEGGMRFYDDGEIIRLLSFRKYRQIGFSVQEIVEHFKQDTLPSLADDLVAQSDILVQQSQMLLRRAQSVAQYAERIRYAHAHLDQVFPCESLPPLVVFQPPLAMFSEQTGDVRDALEQCIEAMPAVEIAFCIPPIGEPTFYLCTDEAHRTAWDLPQGDIHPFSSSVFVYRKCTVVPWTHEEAEKTLDWLRAQGYTPRQDAPVWGVHIASETDAHTGHVTLTARYMIEIIPD